MNKPQPTRGSAPYLAHGLEFRARAASSVFSGEMIDGEPELDLNSSTVVLTISGSVQALLDVADAVADSFGEYSRLSESRRRDDPAQARHLNARAARVLEIAQALELAVLNPIALTRSPRDENDDTQG